MGNNLPQVWQYPARLAASCLAQSAHNAGFARPFPSAISAQARQRVFPQAAKRQALLNIDKDRPTTNVFNTCPAKVI